MLSLLSIFITVILFIKFKLNIQYKRCQTEHLYPKFSLIQVDYNMILLIIRQKQGYGAIGIFFDSKIEKKLYSF